MTNETPWTEVQGFFRATRLRRINSASLRAPFIPRLKSLGFSGRFYKVIALQGVSNVGKSETVKKAYELLKAMGEMGDVGENAT